MNLSPECAPMETINCKYLQSLFVVKLQLIVLQIIDFLVRNQLLTGPALGNCDFLNCDSQFVVTFPNL